MLQRLARALDLQGKLFQGFADRSRIAIVNALRDGPLPVGEIVAGTSL